jgi:hypothetical protein
MPRVEFEHAISVYERETTVHALDPAANEIGLTFVVVFTIVLHQTEFWVSWNHFLPHVQSPYDPEYVNISESPSGIYPWSLAQNLHVPRLYILIQMYVLGIILFFPPSGSALETIQSNPVLSVVHFRKVNGLQRVEGPPSLFLAQVSNGRWFLHQRQLCTFMAR